jgi:phosphohistidine phosphatase
MSEGISLYLVRHAIAAERGETFPDDGKRPLTSKGIERFREVAKALGDLDVEIDQVLTSPLARARQTADILAELLPGGAPVVETDTLAPGSSFRAVVDMLAAYSRYHALVLVGHEPGIGEIAGRLIGTRNPLPFKKGAVCRIDVDALPPAGPGRLIWFATPKILRKLG